MRFTWGVSKIRANKKSFQFSLWDSIKPLPECNDPNYIIFQFSLWDSQIIADLTIYYYLLSILFMRFYSTNKWYLQSDNFQFSLWDSFGPKLERGGTRLFQFSLWDSNIWVKPDCLLELTFNSLYEIRDKLFSCSVSFFSSFQFSLWDSIKWL